MKRMKVYCKLLALLFVLPVYAADNLIEIVDGVESGTPIAVAPFGWEASGPPSETDIAKVISDDLARSGLFIPMDRAQMFEQPSRISEVQFGNWRRLKVDYLLIGLVQGDPLDGYRVDVRLLNVFTGDTVVSKSFPSRPGSMRYTAHYIADTVYEELVNIPGVFRTRIAYVTSEGVGEETKYALMVADADGYNPQPVVRSKQPLLSPSWSPDGQRLAYVSFEGGNSSIYLQQINSGQREKIAGFKGINGAPSWSPDSSKLALTLSRTGNPEIYVMDISSRRLVQLTEHWAIDTEPVWMPDGRNIVFTSDRGGKPQLYQIQTNGREKPTRLTRGEYNARASLSPDGEKIALVNGQDNRYRIGLLDVERDVMRILSDGPLDESPSFAPNGTMVLFASREDGQGVLSAIPVIGEAAASKITHRLIFSEGDIREPAWSPIR